MFAFALVFLLLLLFFGVSIVVAKKHTRVRLLFIYTPTNLFVTAAEMLMTTIAQILDDDLLSRETVQVSFCLSVHQSSVGFSLKR